MPQWKQSLTKSLHQTRSTPESRYFQLATVDKDGFPFCRTVVYRGLTDNNQLVVVSDTRTEKYQQLMQNQHAEACWYFAKTREQYRFRCTGSIVTVLDDQPLVSAHWNKLSDAGKKQFLWGNPGSERTSGYTTFRTRCGSACTASSANIACAIRAAPASPTLCPRSSARRPHSTSSRQMYDPLSAAAVCRKI